MNQVLFYIGADAGFFSEYNNMLFAIIYCKLNNIKFTLASHNATFAYQKGWQDYFVPFCSEFNPQYNRKFNLRYEPYKIESTRDKWKWLFYKTLLFFRGIDTLTYDIFYKARQLSPQQIYSIPDLAGNATLLEHCKVLNQQIWKYNEVTKDAVVKRLCRLQIPQRYVSLHIRRGDKHIETEHTQLNKYIELLQQHTDCRDVFVATDDYSVIDELRHSYPNYTFYTLTSPQNKGYDQRTFEKQNPEKRRENMYDLFADVELIKQSECFVGTLSSNIGMYLYMVMGAERCFGVDYAEWKIW